MTLVSDKERATV